MDKYFVSILGRKLSSENLTEVLHQNVVKAKSKEQALRYCTNKFLDMNPMHVIESVLISEESKLNDFTVPDDV